MKKIYYNSISKATNNEGYEVEQESFECEYSEEWFDGEEDPIGDYVRNMLENECVDFEEEGYTWDDGKESINWGALTMEGANHILYKDGEPIEVYYVSEDSEE